MKTRLVLLAIALAACKGGDRKESAPPPKPSAPAVAPSAVAPTPTAPPSAAAPPPEADAEAGCPDDMIAVASGCIDKREVLVSDYAACAVDKACPPAETTVAGPNVGEAERALFDPLCNAHKVIEMADHPMNCVDLAGADAFCKAHGKRLPTAAEWERAARGVGGGKYPWGASSPVSSLVNACGAECVTWKKAHKDLVAKIRGMSVSAEAYPGDDGFAATAQPGSFALGASSVGAVDMAGNVEEWTQGGEVRGGSWLSTRDAELRADARRALDPTRRSATVGFRCAK